jgi:hypothetical protein
MSGLEDIWRGRIPLGRAFCCYTLVLAPTFRGIVFSALAGHLIWAGIGNAFLILCSAAVWRSSNEYSGPRHWKLLARAGILFESIIPTLLYIVIILSSL